MIRLPRLMLVILTGVVLGGALCPAGYASGKLYRWVDAQGQAHFSDQPHGDAQPFDPHLPTVGGDKQPAADAVTVDAKACSQRQAELARYRKASSITETDSLGKIHTYTADERQQLIDRTKAAVTSACGKSQDDSASETSDVPTDGPGGY